MAKDHAIILKNFHLSSSRTRILMELIVGTMYFWGTNRKSYGENSGATAKF